MRLQQGHQLACLFPLPGPHTFSKAQAPTMHTALRGGLSVVTLSRGGRLHRRCQSSKRVLRLSEALCSLGVQSE